MQYVKGPLIDQLSASLADREYAVVTAALKFAAIHSAKFEEFDTLEALRIVQENVTDNPEESDTISLDDLLSL